MNSNDLGMEHMRRFISLHKSEHSTSKRRRWVSEECRRWNSAQALRFKIVDLSSELQLELSLELLPHHHIYTCRFQSIGTSLPALFIDLRLQNIPIDLLFLAAIEETADASSPLSSIALTKILVYVNATDTGFKPKNC